MAWNELDNSALANLSSFDCLVFPVMFFVLVSLGESGSRDRKRKDCCQDKTENLLHCVLHVNCPARTCSLYLDETANGISSSAE